MLAVLAGPVLARETAPVATARSRATLVSDVDQVASGQAFRVGLRIVLAPGWHTYGQNPGDAGEPTEFTLTLPGAASAGAIDWPQPQRFVDGPVTMYGYTGAVLLPITVTPVGPTDIVAHANWLVCKDVCIPELAEFRLSLPAGDPAPSAQASLFAPASTPGMAAPAETSSALPNLLVLGFLGGLVLNLMPCVFPVLAMKAVSFAGGVARGEVRAQAASYSAGVVLAFAGLGGGLLVARSLGVAAGWGFQFQSPLFVASMALLLFVVGLNLSGVFEIGHGLAGTGHALTTRHGHAGSFFTGLLAVLVATPCTAPFMGVALATALAAPALPAMLIFVAMGIGLAAPTLLLAASPGLARLAPRPGRWMLVLKQALAFPMYAAVVWLVWVLLQQSGPNVVLAALAALLLAGFAAWAFGSAQHRGGPGAAFGRIVALTAALAAVALVMRVEPEPGLETRGADGAEPFSLARLAALREEGRPVFVDMTAAWCVTCLVNEQAVIRTGAVQRAFAAHRVAYLKGDWTRQDPQITAFLREHGRDGVPLYVYYPAGAPAAVLPQILTQGTVLDRIEAAPG